MNFTNPKIEEAFKNYQDRMDKTIVSVKAEYQSIRAGRANPHILDKIFVDYYGTQTAVNQVGNITVPEARMLVITPWDVSVLSELEKSLKAANLGIYPVNDGKVIRLTFPALTEERRKDLVKQIKKTADDGKVSLRNVRRDVLETLKKAKTDKVISENEFTLYEKEVDNLINKNNKLIDEILAAKEKDVMTV